MHIRNICSIVQNDFDKLIDTDRIELCFKPCKWKIPDKKELVMRYIKCFLLITLFVGLTVLFGGCAAVAHDLEINKDPYLLDVLKSAPTVNDDMARVVLYYPRDFAFSLRGLGHAGMGVKKIKIQGVAGSIAFEVLDQCGYYIDIPGGEYAFDEAPDQNFTFQNGTVQYIKIGKKESGVSMHSMGGIKPTLMDEPTARSEMAKFKIKTSLANNILERKVPCNYDALRIALIPNNIEKSKLIPQLTDMSARSVEKKIEQEPIASELTRLYIINDLNFVGGATKLEVGIDGTPNSVKLGRKKYMCIDMTPGSHLLSTRISAFGIKQVPGYLQRFNLEKGIEHYCVYDAQKGFHFCSTEKGRELVKKYKLIKGGYYSLAR